MTNANILSKKSVSFPEEVVSEVHSVGSYEESDLDMLFYSQEDFRRFKLERRIARNRNQQRNAQRNRIQRRGMYDCLMGANRKESVSSRVARMNSLMEMGHESQQIQLVGSC